MALVELVPVAELGTSLAPLRGERTDSSPLAALPLRVARARDGSCEVLDGFKRLALWRGEGRTEVPVVIEPAEGPAMKARLLDANAPPKTSSPMDEARVVASLVDDGLSVAAIAKLLGKKPAWVDRRLTLARRLAPDLGSRVDRGRLSLTLACALTVFSASEQGRLAKAIERHALTTRETEAFLATYRAAVHAPTQEALLRDPRSAQPQVHEQGASPLGPTAAAIQSRFDDLDRALDELASADFSVLSDTEERVLEARRRQLVTRLTLFKEALDESRGDPGSPRPGLSLIHI